jgi:hypothetical protein
MKKGPHVKGASTGTKLYGAALGTAVLAGFFTGAWPWAFWIAAAPFIARGVEIAVTRKSP